MKIRHTMILNVADTAGRVLDQRMKMLNNIKLDKICISEAYNTKANIIRNIFCSSLLQACRYIVVVRKMFHKNDYNQKFLIKMVCKSVSRLQYRVRNQILKNNLDSSMDFETVRWIAYKAFHKKLSENGYKFRGVLRAIKRKMNILQQKFTPTKISDLGALEANMPDFFKW
ncbi:hypothetical protein C0J52_16628 [Blattella germanica]|nr:hypothetical protein C0J52_16628 [Blattella germanica]